MNSSAMTIINDDDQDWLPSPFPGSEGSFFKVLKADVANNRAVLKFKFGPGSGLPRHIHHCRAVAYTIAGGWEYDEGSFEAGHVAYEEVGNDHTAVSKDGAELFLFFDSDSERMLDNYFDDGTVVQMDMAFFKAYEGLSLAEAAKVNLEDVVTIVPGNGG